MCGGKLGDPKLGTMDTIDTMTKKMKKIGPTALARGGWASGTEGMLARAPSAKVCTSSLAELSSAVTGEGRSSFKCVEGCVTSP